MLESIPTDEMNTEMINEKPSSQVVCSTVQRPSATANTCLMNLTDSLYYISLYPSVYRSGNRIMDEHYTLTWKISYKGAQNARVV